jgi:hypothetical protein
VLLLGAAYCQVIAREKGVSMAGRVEKWQSRRQERRQERLEEMARRLAAGGRPMAGGAGFKLLALAVILALGVAIYLMLNSFLDSA